MFDRIFIKSKKSDGQRIDIGFLIDTMLFYGNVIVLAHKEEIKLLIKHLGPELMENLIKSGRLDLKIRMNMFSASTYPLGTKKGYNLNLMHAVEETHEGLLYSAHREIINNSTTNLKFAEKFSKITNPFEFQTSITDRIRDDFKSQSLIKKTLPLYFKEIVPSFIPPETIEIEINETEKFGPFDAYSFNSNIDLEELNNQYKKQVGEENYHPLDYSGYLLALGESQGDIYISCEFESEIVTKDLYSKFIESQFQEIIQKRLQSQDNINLFDEYVLTNCYTIGDAFVKGILSSGELLALLEKADKFRHWLKDVPDDKSLIGEYHKAVAEEEFKDKLGTKTTRFMIFEGIGIAADLAGAGGLGTVAATALSAIDAFYLDKLLKGKWKPNHYIDGVLKPKIEK